jgi:hypothetical protein
MDAVDDGRTEQPSGNSGRVPTLSTAFGSASSTIPTLARDLVLRGSVGVSDAIWAGAALVESFDQRAEAGLTSTAQAHRWALRLPLIDLAGRGQCIPPEAGHAGWSTRSKSPISVRRTSRTMATTRAIASGSSTAGGNP